MNYDNVTIKELLDHRDHSHQLSTKTTIIRARQRELYEEGKEIEENEDWYSSREL